MTPPIRPNVLRLQPYSPGKPVAEVKRELGLDRVVKLASNENPLGPSPRAIEAVHRAAATMHVYPDGAVYDLKAALSQKLGVAPAQLMVGNGSDELIHLLGLVFLGEEGDEMVIGAPSFARYDPAAQLVPCRLVKVPLDGDYRHDLPAMARASNERTKLLFIANPNNPTGTIVTKAAVDRLLDDLPPQVVVVLDEAYYEFAAHLPEMPNAVDYVRAGRENVVALRTFSKSHGLAGIRVGYGVAHEAVIDAVNRAREPFNVNALAQAAAVAGLEDEAHVERTVENNRRGMERISRAFRDLGARVVDGYANFVWADLGRPARPVFQALLERGVIVRCGDVLGDPNCLRVSVGTEEEVDFFVEALQSVMGEVEVAAR